jgi:hypothetical protein
MATTENDPAARNDNFVGLEPKFKRVVAMVLRYMENSSCRLLVVKSRLGNNESHIPMTKMSFLQQNTLSAPPEQEHESSCLLEL